MVRVKVCGVTSVGDAAMCLNAGVDAIGLNFWPGSVRRCEEKVAQAIAQLPRAKALLVGVFVNEQADEIRRLIDSVGLDCVQLHGEEPPDFLASFLPHAYKALRVRGPEILDEVRRFPGEHVLLDAYVKGVPGGTGATFDWSSALAVTKERKLTLAGGLTPDNVADAVRCVRPYCVDTASGVESAPGVKDPQRVRAFVARAKAAHNTAA